MFELDMKRLTYDQYSYHRETSQLIFEANQLDGIHMLQTLIFNKELLLQIVYFCIENTFKVYFLLVKVSKIILQLQCFTVLSYLLLFIFREYLAMYFLKKYSLFIGILGYVSCWSAFISYIRTVMTSTRKKVTNLI